MPPRRFETARSTWYVWLFPVIAIAIAAWLLWEHFEQRGPEIKISFDDATGIQAEKTRVRFRGVSIGIVRKVVLAPDHESVIAHVQLQKDAQQFAVAGSKFWLVMPKVNFQGVSGLETLFEGTYISVQPGSPSDERKLEFRSQVGRDTVESVEDTSAYLLETDQAGAISDGDAITYRGLKVGQVSRVTLSRSAQTVLVTINIQNRYARLVRENSVFWRKAAVQAKLGLFNSELKISSMDQLLHGGIDFFTPNEVGPQAKAGARFPMAGGPPKDLEKWNPKLD